MQELSTAHRRRLAKRGAGLRRRGPSALQLQLPSGLIDEAGLQRPIKGGQTRREGQGPEREREGILDSFQAVGQRGQGVFVKTIICCLDPIPQPTSRASPPLLLQQPLAVGWGTADHAPACGLRAPNRQPIRQSRRCLHRAQTSSLPQPSRSSQPPS